MAYTFDGPNKLIIISAVTTFTVIDMYSRWKEWVQTDDNSKYIQAFRSIAGDPIGPGLAVAPYVFLNTTDGWRIRPGESNHELAIVGNLYSEDSLLSMFVPTVGTFTVNVIIERSSAAIAVTVGGIDQATVQSALTAQGYTTTRAPKIDQLDDINSAVTYISGTVSALYDISYGRWKIVSNQMIFYADDNVTEVVRFNLLNAAGAPAMTGVFERQKV